LPSTVAGVTLTFDRRGRSSLSIVKVGTVLGSSLTNTLARKKSLKASGQSGEVDHPSLSILPIFT